MASIKDRPIKILVYGDLSQKQNNFGIWDSISGRVIRSSYLDLYQDLRFDGVKYINVGMRSTDGAICMKGGYCYIQTIPATYNEFAASNLAWIIDKSNGKYIVLLLPSNTTVTFNYVTDLAGFIKSMGATQMNFKFNLNKNGMYTVHTSGIGD